ncbi:DUF6542 domain-containing protein [uncultured Jatrophihabitans sp.]|uniref:DUF6542 domain-containing protein n=1 Tax=uncultured Jatrophihabitans sp. TaxID=1610747 RepID=UPI0035C9B66D
MTDRSAARRGWPSSGRSDDDGWGPSTAVYSGSNRSDGAGRDDAFARAFQAPAPEAPARRPAQQSPQRPAAPRGGGQRPPVDPRAAAAPTRDKQRANRQMERQIAELRNSARPNERGVPWWAALVVLIVIAGVGGLIDTIGTTAARGGFNVGIVVASIVAVLIVRRSHMFPVVIAPPIVYTLAAVFQLYLRSSGLHDKKVVYDAASNYLVYGFPAIAAATAAVLIIAGFRLITRK